MGQRTDTLTKLIPQKRDSCPHMLGQHVLATAKSTALYPDGNTRPAQLRGGRMVTVQHACVYAAGHTGAHVDASGKAWS
jgi:hypothetical protein